MSKGYCFSANRICHHDDYYLLISKIGDVENVKSFWRKLYILVFTNRKVFFLDIDKTDLVFFPLIVLRSLYGGAGIGISVRTDYLIQNIKLVDFFREPLDSKYFHLRAKQLIFLIIKYLSRTSVYSIHKNHYEMTKMEKYVSGFFYDPQLWDLKLLKIQPIAPPELTGLTLNHKKVCLIAGRLDEQRSKDELVNYLLHDKSDDFLFIIAGKVDKEDLPVLSSVKDCFIINRFLSNEELMYLYDICDLVYCFYTSNRPSGFFGRALQKQKNVLVRKDGYLHRNYSFYPGTIAIERLDGLRQIRIHEVSNNCELMVDDSEYFRNIINIG